MTVPEEKNAGFVHSVPVPQLYKFSAKILRQYLEKKGSLKNLTYSVRFKVRCSNY